MRYFPLFLLDILVFAFSEVLATGASTGVNVGDQAGHGISAIRTPRIKKFFQEHGYVHAYLSVRPKAIYETAIPRHFLRETYQDYFQEELQSLGPQQVLTKEVYADHTNDTDIFGYAERFSEYRQQPSQISSQFLSTDSPWHLGRGFTSAPTLNEDFIKCDPKTDSFAVTSGPNLRIEVAHNIKAMRCVRGLSK